MSAEKQIRLLNYKPTIIVATPGRLWEMMTEYNNRYLLEALPMTDVIVLDEADRLIADGHFKELRDILAHIYTQRLKIKTKKSKAEIEEALPKIEAINTQDFKIGKNLEGKTEKIDWSKVKDLYDDDEILDEMENEGVEIDDESKPKKEANEKTKKLRQKQIEALEDEKIHKRVHKSRWYPAYYLLCNLDY